MNKELFKLRAGIDLTHVPFKGSGPAAADVMAGNTQVLMVDSLGAVRRAMSTEQFGKFMAQETGITEQ